MVSFLVPSNHETFVNPFRAPEPLLILNPSSFVPKNGLPVVKGLNKIAGLGGGQS